MMISCNDVRPLLPGYLDGELSEAQAAPARAHLMDCFACRELVQEGKVLSRWFRRGQGPQLLAPKGFSSRVARRAFAGDLGLLTPVSSAAGQPRSTLPFLLKLSALAAGLLFLFAIQIKRQSLPDAKDVEAGNYSPPWVEEPEAPAASAVLGLPAGAAVISAQEQELLKRAEEREKDSLPDREER